VFTQIDAARMVVRVAEIPVGYQYCRQIWLLVTVINLVEAVALVGIRRLTGSIGMAIEAQAIAR
jgi:hypothetical protein